VTVFWKTNEICVFSSGPLYSPPPNLSSEFLHWLKSTGLNPTVFSANFLSSVLHGFGYENKRSKSNQKINMFNSSSGVPVVAQWLTNPTRNHEVAGSVPALAQWVNDLALP